MTKKMILKDSLSTFVVYFNNGEADFMIGSFPKSEKLALVAAAMSLTGTMAMLNVDDIVLDNLGLPEAAMMLEAVKDASYTMSHIRHERTVLTKALDDLLMTAGGVFPIAD